uniref:Uncharacterized protein n=1 Tax=Mimivirus LCMiAC01 TaxID=2506608 RepID=A0A481YZS9_9VIRU|nr:MAG: uncharacterized protein LCMiAC01_01770 [Mimivirus LCMiAC01]
MKIYKILEYKRGIIEPEDLMTNARFDVKFSCKLCTPLKGKQIICEVNRVNKPLLTAENGPIVVIITNERINDEHFFTDNNNNLRYKTKNKSIILKPNEFVKITLITITFNDGDDKIKAIGFLDNMAIDEDIDAYYADYYNTSDNTRDQKIGKIVEDTAESTEET